MALTEPIRWHQRLSSLYIASPVTGAFAKVEQRSEPRISHWPATAVAADAAWAMTSPVRLAGIFGCTPVEDVGGPVDERQWLKLSAGARHNCGILLDDGALRCWGNNDYYQAPRKPEDKFIDVSAGEFNTCAVKEDGSVQCWGDDSHGVMAQQRGEFTQVAVSKYHACGLFKDYENNIQRAKCWGDGAGGGSSPDPILPFINIDAGAFHTCGIYIEVDQSIPEGFANEFRKGFCWGKENIPEGENYRQANLEDVQSPNLTFEHVSAGYHHSCALTRNTAVDDYWECGEGEQNCAPPVLGAIKCWGDVPHKHYPPEEQPRGEYVDVSAGRYHTCGVKVSGAIDCWGDIPGVEDFHQSKPIGNFSKVTSGYYHSCAMRVDGTAVCWGGNDDGQADVLEIE